MAVETDNQDLRAELAVKTFTQGAINAATDIGWVDMRDFDSILISGVATALTGVGLTTFKILANSASDGSGTDVEVKVHALGTAPDAVGDQVFLEATAEEIRQAGVAAGHAVRYVSANAVAANAADRVAFTYIRRGKRKYRNLTADIIA